MPCSMRLDCITFTELWSMAEASSAVSGVRNTLRLRLVFEKHRQRSHVVEVRVGDDDGIHRCPRPENRYCGTAA